MRRLVLFFAVLTVLGTQAQDRIRVACVGNSITYGHGIENRDRDSYPAQLQQLAGVSYEVRNFGVCACTALTKGDHPYVNEPTYKEALAFLPQYVFLKLGTNDSKSYNWVHQADFEKDVEAICQSFQELPSHPVIFLCLPATAFENNFHIDGQVIACEIIPKLRDIAARKHYLLVDMHTPTQDQKAHFPDGVHPDPAGCNLLARLAWNALKEKK